MTASYVAWNGKSYPAPPPEGWYEASDGRWWAPGTGPNPPKMPNGATTTPEASRRSDPNEADDTPRRPEKTSPANGATLAARAAAPPTKNDMTGADGRASGDPEDEPVSVGSSQTDEDRLSGDGGADGQQDTILTRPRTPGLAVTTADLPRAGDTRTADDIEPGSNDSPSSAGTAGPTASSESTSGRRRLFLSGAVLLSALVVSVVGLFVLTRSDENDQNASQEVATATGPEPDSEQGTDTEPEVDPESEGAASANPAAPDAETGSASGPATEPDSTTTTQEASTTSTTDEAPPTTRSNDELVAQFRANLAASDLSSDRLTQDDILEFGNSFCALAIVSADAEAFDLYRQRALRESTGELTNEELSVAIDQALTVFCPGHAARVGVPATSSA